MSDESTAGSGTQNLSRGDRVEVIKILILAVISFLAGFALVFIFLRPPSPGNEEAPLLAGNDEIDAERNDEIPAEGYAPGDLGADQARGDGYAPGPAGDQDESEQVASEGSALPEVPPGKIPDDVLLDGDAFYLKCWGDDGVEHKGDECDKLNVLERRFSTRLYVVDKCRSEKAGADAGGKLSVACEVDFAQDSISFWNGASSDVKNASQIGSCMRQELAGLPIHEVDHKYSRYRIFFTVLFGKAAEKLEAKEEAKQEAIQAKIAAGKGRLVDVIKDRVRVRKAPIDGDIIGKISSGNQVRLLKKKDGWCNIITPNENEGWMICNALEL